LILLGFSILGGGNRLIPVNFQVSTLFSMVSGDFGLAGERLMLPGVVPRVFSPQSILRDWPKHSAKFGLHF
jgi:hypothetical protein